MEKPHDDRSIGRLISLILRHDPQLIGCQLDDEGYLPVLALLAGVSRKLGFSLTRDHLDYIVATNNKKRYEYSPDGTKIRARQGHSIDVDLGLAPVEPPTILYHGTAERFLPAILSQGLVKMSRQHVHLSADKETAIAVGKRHGKPVVLQVAAGQMSQTGQPFYQSHNGVWLIEEVAPAYLTLLGD